MTLQLTDDERDLLRDCAHLLGEVIADPQRGVESLRTSRMSGGRPNYTAFDFWVDSGRLCGSWKRGEVVERLTDGRVCRWHFEPPHRTASITFPRLRRWAESLPDELRVRARAAWAVGTRDLAALRQIEREAVEHGVVEQLDLFEAAS